jgi:ABC-type branched-subunit amino acid transport system ATPase component
MCNEDSSLAANNAARVIAMPAPGTPAGSRRSTDAPALSLDGICVRFGGTQALNNVTFSVESGEVVALIGPNGAGKTTLFDAVSGIRWPDQGRIALNGRNITRMPPVERSRHGLKRTFQRVQTFGWLSVEDNVLTALESAGGLGGMLADLVAFPARSRTEKQRRARVREVLELCGLDAVRREPAGSLPIGLARMVEFARALIPGPKVLLLDEPSSGLDHGESSRLIGVIRQVKAGGDCAVLLVEHDMGFVMSQSDKVVVLNLGEILTVGSPAQVQEHSEVRAAYLGNL